MLDIMVLICVSTFVHVLVPESQSDGIRKAVSFLAGLALLLAVCEPIAETVDKLSILPEKFLALVIPDTESVKQTESDAEKWVVRYGIKNIEHGVNALVESKFHLSTGSVTTEVETGSDETGAITVECLRIRISREAICDLREIESYVSSLLSCECVAYIGETE